MSWMQAKFPPQIQNTYVSAIEHSCFSPPLQPTDFSESASPAGEKTLRNSMQVQIGIL